MKNRIFKITIIAFITCFFTGGKIHASSASNFRYVVFQHSLVDTETFRFNELTGNVYDGIRYVFVCNESDIIAYDKLNGEKCNEWKVKKNVEAFICQDHLICSEAEMLTVYQPDKKSAVSFLKSAEIKKNSSLNFIFDTSDHLFLFSDNARLQIVNLKTAASKNINLAKNNLPGKYKGGIYVEQQNVFCLEIFADTTKLFRLDTAGNILNVYAIPGEFVLRNQSFKNYIFLTGLSSEKKEKTVCFDLSKETFLPISYNIIQVLKNENNGDEGLLSFDEVSGMLSFYQEADASEKWNTKMYANGFLVKGFIYKNMLIPLIYSPIAASAKVFLMEPASGNIKWHKDTGVEIAHSQYYNKSEVYCYNDHITVIGNEASVNYIQVFDFLSGKLLFEKINKL